MANRDLISQLSFVTASNRHTSPDTSQFVYTRLGTWWSYKEIINRMVRYLIWGKFSTILYLLFPLVLLLSYYTFMSTMKNLTTPMWPIKIKHDMTSIFGAEYTIMPGGSEEFLDLGGSSSPPEPAPPDPAVHQAIRYLLRGSKSSPQKSWKFPLVNSITFFLRKSVYQTIRKLFRTIPKGGL